MGAEGLDLVQEWADSKSKVITEADTCRIYIVPKLHSAGWDDDQINEQKTFTDGRILVVGNKPKRQKQKRADFLLRYRRDLMIAVVEAKPVYKTPSDGLQQAKEYAEILGLKFAYSSNGHGIVEYDFITGKEKALENFPSPDELWHRLQPDLKIAAPEAVERYLSPFYQVGGKTLRYYQEIAVNRALQAILQGKKRVLLTMATGTGKTLVAFQICWKLWSTRWNATGEHRRPKILYLSDRNILIDDPKDKTFVPFGDTRWKIQGEAIKGREMYFAIYQAIAKDGVRPGLYKEYPRDFFDFIIVDECHRGSAKDESNWREILEYFHPAYQLGMTATPLREENKDTYRYFGNPVYTYSLRQGIEDGFLAPYRVHRVVTDVDAAGWRPSKEEIDRYGRMIPDEEYTTAEFERILALRARTEAIAKHLTEYLKKTGRFDKTIVFCVDQEHADEIRKALNNLNSDLTKQHPDYVYRVVSEEGDVGRGHLSRFQELESSSPVILTTSRLLTTGVDIPTCKNIVIVRVIKSMTEFKQIIGRGTRVRDDYGKFFFNILDYTGSATRLFADPDFDSEPLLLTETSINEAPPVVIDEPPIDGGDVIVDGPIPPGPDEPPPLPRKYYADGGAVEIVAHIVHELDADGKKLRVVKYTDYTAEKVRQLCPSGAVELRARWSDAEKRAAIISALEERGVSFEELAEVTKQPEADPFDLLCHVVYNAPLRTRRERAEKLKKDKKEFFERYHSAARAVLEDILEKYAEHGTPQFKIPDILKVPPISERGTVTEIAKMFGGSEKLREAVIEMQKELYAA